jgi:Peptidase of plants and bacteria
MNIPSKVWSNAAMESDPTISRRTCCWHLLIFLLLASLPATGAESVRKVKFSGTPERPELAEHVRQIGNEFYPKILALFPDDAPKVAQRFDIIFKPLKSHNSGETDASGAKIYLNSDYLTNNPAVQNWIGNNITNFDKVFIHEMAHMAQRYKTGARIPFYWEEGMADYVRFKLGYTHGWECAECSAEYPHYISGYTCMGAFLLYIDATCGPKVIRQLHTELRRGSYSDAFFPKTTGSSLDTLWAQFQNTPAFTPTAAQADKVLKEIGYLDGKPPKDITARFKTYVQQHGDPDVIQFFKYVDALPATDMYGRSLKEIQNQLRIYLYFIQPGGAPEALLRKMLKQGELPGFAKSDHGWVLGALNLAEMDPSSFPAYRTLHCKRNKELSTYHYTFVHPSSDAAWTLQKAWQTNPDGVIVMEYPVR